MTDEFTESRRPTAEEDAARFLESGFWRDRSMLDDILDHVATTPQKAAIVTYRSGSTTPVTLTYGRLGTVVDRIARGLLELGIERGDVVSIQLPNGWEFAATTLAAMRIGAVVNPLVAIFRRRELEFMLARARSKVLIVPETFRGFSHAQLAAELRDVLPELRDAVVVGSGGPAALPEGLLEFDEFFLQRDRPRQPLTELHRQPDEIATLMYTSGTTGEPKGTLHTANTLWSAGCPLFDSLGLVADDVCFMASTMGHLTGFLWGMLQPLARGMTVVFQDVWDPAAFVRLVGEERITWTLSATPFVVDSVEAQLRDQRDLSTFRYFVCAGAPIPSALPPRATEVLGAKLMALWGTSECGICTIHTPDAPVAEVAGSDGRPTPVMQVRLVDELGEPVPDGTPGRLLTRGPSMFVGYLGRRDLYDSVVDPNGWFDTGDLGYRTPEGGVRISGRSKDIIIRGGENIPVVEIENLLFTHPRVKEVAVVAYADERLGERACAVVVPDGEAPTLAELTAFLAGAGTATQYWPERLEIRPEMPRTPSGKIQKFKLRDEVGALVGRTVFEGV
ncbi:MAG: AMP-binding protein [Pseudonocardia sp.]|uniref:AMP-binding protein n=1 Tax=Pseudonocardia sp. TaxID=60912 RepID=UPI001AD3BA40|nr:AMP-binding protein [Pseudonocardia sp.]MBN9097512.1 AMP-binding protein [Pseudonocardia sp.]